MLSPSEKAKIQKQARGILDKFARKLEKVKGVPKAGKRDGKLSGFREEGNGLKADEDFRERIFENAPKSQGDFFIAEKKEW